MTLYLKVIAVTIPLMVALDLLWLGVIMKDFYRAQIGHLMAQSFALWPAVAFYILYAIGLAFFATMPGIAAGSVMRAALLGAALGFIAYATYDLSNWATLKDWPALVAFADIAWGTVLTATLSGTAAWVALTFFVR